MFGTIISYLHYPFARYALIVGVLVALCASLLGVTLVLKRFSFIGDGLSHVAFGAIAVASVIQLGLSALQKTAFFQNAAFLNKGLSGLNALTENTNNMIIVLPLTMLAAVLLLRTGQNTKIKGDAAIAMISVSALAGGYILMAVFSTSSNMAGDVCSTLFGSQSILTLGLSDVIFCLVLSVVSAALFILFYQRIFAVTFDETFARAVGTKASAVNLLIAVMIALIIVLAMRLVGSLLVSALIIFPALSAMRIARSFRQVTIVSVILAGFSALTGVLLSIALSLPVGATIVMTELLVFFVLSVVGKLRAG
ncbi:MAG: metal ABC transporter permease [Lachnospiraceae bacterium]|nr:metal ABC transporter permease [Lachnospiraceae bacterium]